MKTSFLDFNSIQKKILFFGGIALLLVAVGIIGYAAVTLNQTAVLSAREDLSSIADRESGRVQAVLVEPFTTSSAAAAQMAGIRDKNSNFPRDDVNSMVYGILRDRPLYNGIYTIWEPGVFDSKDSEYKLKDGFDKTGRLRYYWYRDGSGNLVRKMYDATTGDPGSYYDLPRANLKGAIIEPYIETMQGAPVLLASLVIPIIRDGTFNGIVGVDVALQDIETIADSLDIYQGTGKMIILSNGGIVAGATGDLDVMGKPIEEVAPLFDLDAGMIKEAVSAGKPISFEDSSHLGAIVPVTIGDTETPWGVVVFAPTSEVTHEAMMQTVALILIGILISCIGMGLLYIVARSIARPIADITAVSLLIAEGDLNTSIAIEQQDEVGRLADAFRQMLGSLRGKADAAEQIAIGNLAIDVPVASERDQLGHSMIMMRDAVSAVTQATKDLAENAAAGNLSIRGDVTKFSGEFAAIVTGFNRTLDNLIAPLNEAMNLAGKYATDNFSARFNPTVPVAGDFIPFRDAMNGIGIQVSDTIRVIISKMADLQTGAERAQVSADEVANGSSEVARFAGAVSENTDQGSEEISQILKAMEDLSMAVSDISVKTEGVSRLAEEGNQLSNEGEALAKTAGTGMEGIRDATEDIARMIHTIKEQMEQITSAVTIISSISDETNLLALNAAIEAARAGDAGKGFAVVADEVKQLATESHQSAEKIEEMIRNLSRESANATNVMEKAQEQVLNGYAAVQQTLEIFNRIVTMLYEITKNVSEVAAATEEQAASVEEITASINEVNDMIRKTAENAVSSAAISEESSSAVDQIRRVIEEVNQVVTILQKEIDRFSI